jgi:hypothetical protein
LAVVVHGWDHENGQKSKEPYHSEHEVLVSDHTKTILIEGVSICCEFLLLVLVLVMMFFVMIITFLLVWNELFQVAALLRNLLRGTNTDLA